MKWTNYSPMMRVVAATDLSEAGESALRHAMRLTKNYAGSRLYVVHVLEQGLGWRLFQRLDALDTEMRFSERALSEQLRRAGASELQNHLWSRQVETQVMLGRPAETIHQHAVDVDADLIVVGSQQGARFGRGRVARRLTRMAALPVLVARPKDIAALTPSEAPEPPGLLDPQPVRKTRRTSDYPRSLASRALHISGLI